MKLESNNDPERARVSQRVAVRASGSQSGSHRKLERASKSLREPEGARVGVAESYRETGRDKGRASKSQRKPYREPEGTRVS